MKTFHEVYEKSIKADDLFEKAIKKQFGDKASRWDFPQKLWNQDTRIAYLNKRISDDDMHNYFNDKRSKSKRIIFEN